MVMLSTIESRTFCLLVCLKMQKLECVCARVILSVVLYGW
jgi:hypothetical protein